MCVVGPGDISPTPSTTEDQSDGFGIQTFSLRHESIHSFMERLRKTLAGRALKVKSPSLGTTWDGIEWKNKGHRRCDEMRAAIPAKEVLNAVSLIKKMLCSLEISHPSQLSSWNESIAAAAPC